MTLSDKWVDRFLNLARCVASWSKDPSTQVGAVIVDENRIIRGVGYNGLPRGVEDREERLTDRALKYPRVVHAEANAILNAATSVRGCSIVVTFPPCADCAKLIIQSGIREVYYHAPPASGDVRWGESLAVAEEMLREAGVYLISYQDMEPRP